AEDDISKIESIEKTATNSIPKTPPANERAKIAIQLFCVWGNPFFQQTNPKTNIAITKIVTYVDLNLGITAKLNLIRSILPILVVTLIFLLAHNAHHKRPSETRSGARSARN